MKTALYRVLMLLAIPASAIFGVRAVMRGGSDLSITVPFLICGLALGGFVLSLISKSAEKRLFSPENDGDDDDRPDENKTAPRS